MHPSRLISGPRGLLADEREQRSAANPTRRFTLLTAKTGFGFHAGRLFPRKSLQTWVFRPTPVEPGMARPQKYGAFYGRFFRADSNGFSTAFFSPL
jgi:hypothetical protein